VNNEFDVSIKKNPLLFPLGKWDHGKSNSKYYLPAILMFSSSDRRGDSRGVLKQL